MIRFINLIKLIEKFIGQNNWNISRGEVNDLREMIESHYHSGQLNNISMATSLQTPKIIADVTHICINNRSMSQNRLWSDKS